MDKKKETGYEAYALVSQLGFTIAIPIILGAASGHWIDGKLGTEPIFLLLL